MKETKENIYRNFKNVPACPFCGAEFEVNSNSFWPHIHTHNGETLMKKSIYLSMLWSERVKWLILFRQRKNYPMTFPLGSDDAESAIAIIDQANDSTKEACIIPSRGDEWHFSGSRLYICLSPESLCVFVRRCLESGDGLAMSLASSICTVINIELV